MNDRNDIVHYNPSAIYYRQHMFWRHLWNLMKLIDYISSKNKSRETKYIYSWMTLTVKINANRINMWHISKQLQKTHDRSFLSHGSLAIENEIWEEYTKVLELFPWKRYCEYTSQTIQFIIYCIKIISTRLP
jgi:hypothetical protein